MRTALFFHLGGDIDILAPFLAPSIMSGSERRVVVSKALLQSNPRLTRALGHYGAAPQVIISPDAEPSKLSAAFKGCDALLTASETTLKPHRFAHAMTREANAAGVATFTFQHGIENVGLTYFDDRHGRDVLFAAQHILAWKGVDRLPSVVDPATRSKVVDAGFPALDDGIFGDLRARLPFRPDGRPVVGVFENLHWTRFSYEYRRRFLDDLQAAVDAFPGVVFLMKPHPEGRWLTERFGGQRPKGDNLHLADPADPDWKMLTAPSLMPLVSAVVTTPSKVALDATVVGKPTAVASYDGQYERYAGLPALAGRPDWFDFVERAAAGEIDRGAVGAFVASTVSGLDGALRAIKIIQELAFR